jgi:spore germination cell wall hydrolase CwlJ-like protein
MAQVVIAARPLDGLGRRARALAASGRELALAEPRAAVAIGLASVAAATAGLFQLLAAADPASAAPPAPPPLLVRAVAPEQAQKINAALPLDNSDNPAATPFRLSGSASARAQALQCLASAVYYEAGNQDLHGARAVAQVVLNRVRHPAFPASVCGVVYQGSTRVTGCQFTFTCDGSLAYRPDAAGWRRAKAVAEAALAGAVYAPVGWATHYHANYVVPIWAASLTKNAVVGAHLFYHWAGGWGRPRAFGQSYQGREASADGLRGAALAAEAATAGQESGPVLSQITALPGVETIKLTPSMRGDKRVAVRFNQVAREATDKVVHEEYVKKVAATDNLRFALSPETTSRTEAPLGKPPAN